MIESVLKEVREAEQEAERMQKEAYRRGKEIVLGAEAEAEAQKKAAVRDCKQERAASLEIARKASLDRAQVIFRKGVESANAMADEKNPAIEETANRVVAMLLDKYGALPVEDAQLEETDAE